MSLLYIKQIGEKDCAFAALKILLANVYKNKDFLYYPQQKLDIAYNLKEIMQIANNEGVKLSVYRISKKEDVYALKKSKALLNLKIENHYHLVYLVKATKKYVIYLDPQLGKIKLKMKDFITIFNGEIMEVTEVRGSNFKFKNKRILSISQSLLLIFLQLITSSLFILGLFYINEEVSFVIPILLFSGFIISLIIFQNVLMYIMKRIDKNLFKKIYRSHGFLKDKYYKINKLKTLAITFPMNIINSIIFIIFSAFILGINNYLNLIAIGGFLIIIIIINLLTNRYLLYQKNELCSLEHQLFKVDKDDIKLEEYFDELNNGTYKVAFLINIKKYIYIFISIVLSLVLASFENEIYLNFVLFYTIAFYYIGDNLDKLFNSDSSYEDYKYYKALYFFHSTNF